MKKRSIAAVVAASVILTSCGNDQAEENVSDTTTATTTTIEETSEITEETETSITPVPVEAGEYEDQLTDILANYDVWDLDEEMTDLAWMDESSEIHSHCYGVTDLDRDGYLEIIKCMTAGSGNYSHSRIFEVMPDGTMEEISGYYSDSPAFGVIGESGYAMGWYEDESGNYWYIAFGRCYDFSGYCTSWRRFSLQDGEIVEEDLGSFGTSFDLCTYRDVTGAMITEYDYIAMLHGYEDGLDGYVTTGWFVDITQENIEASFEAWNTDATPVEGSFTALANVTVEGGYYYIEPETEDYQDYYVDSFEFSDDGTELTFSGAVPTLYDADYVESLAVGDLLPTGDTIETILYDESNGVCWIYAGRDYPALYSFELQANGQYYLFHDGIIADSEVEDMTVPVSPDVVILDNAGAYGSQGILILEDRTEFLTDIDELNEEDRIVIRVADGQVTYIFRGCIFHNHNYMEHFVGEGVIET